jgi:hypothetical protein
MSCRHTAAMGWLRNPKKYPPGGFKSQQPYGGRRGVNVGRTKLCPSRKRRFVRARWRASWLVGDRASEEGESWHRRQGAWPETLLQARQLTVAHTVQSTSILTYRECIITSMPRPYAIRSQMGDRPPIREIDYTGARRRGLTGRDVMDVVMSLCAPSSASSLSTTPRYQ